MSILSFFSKWFYLSIIFILAGLVMSSIQADHESHAYLCGLIASLLESIGVAMFVANIFTFTIGTEQFLSYIRDRLINIVLSREFIAKLNQEEQQSLLHMVLRPSQESADIYSGINQYFDQYVENSMSLFDNCFRGHMVLDAVASIDKKSGRLKVDFELDYMQYKVAKKFEPMLLGLENESFEHVRTVIRSEGNIESEIPADLITEADKIEDPTIKKLYKMKVPEEFNKFNQIGISRNVIEYGNDHWQVFSYKTIKACDRLTVKLRCEDGLVIRDCNTYGISDKFSIKKSERSVKVTFNDWVSPGFGVNILIAKNNFHDSVHNNLTQPTT